MSQIQEFEQKETQESVTEQKSEHPLLSDILINCTETQVFGTCEKIINSKGEKGHCALGVAFIYAR